MRERCGSGDARARRVVAAGVAMLAVCGAMPALAGPWTPKKGDSYNKLAFNFFEGDATFGTPEPGFRSFEDANLTYYLEFGVTDSLAVIASVPFKRIARTDVAAGGTIVSNNTTGIGDVDLGLRYNLSQGPVVVAAQVVFKAPYLYEANNVLPLGNGQEDVEGRLLLGKSLGKAGYFTIDAGYRFRAGAPSDEIRYLVEYGVDVSQAVYVRTKLDGILSVGNDTPTLATVGNPTLPLAFDLAKLEGTAGYRISDQVGAEFTVTHNLYGSNTLRGTAVQLALVVKL